MIASRSCRASLPLARPVAQRLEGFDGPTLGAKLSNVNRRSFSDKQLAEARAAPALLTHSKSLSHWCVEAKRARTFHGAFHSPFYSPFHSC